MDVYPGQHYQHRAKGGVYMVITIAKHTETEEELVIYTRKDHRGLLQPMWARPMSMFTDGRFINVTGEI